MLSRLVPVLAAVCFAGCTSNVTCSEEVPPSYRKLDPKRKDLCAGRYRALDLGDHLVVYATGTHASIGYPVALQVVRGKGDAPYLALYHGRPGPEAIMLPAFCSFIVSAVLERRWVPHRPQFVTVLDARGEHQVKVTGPTEVGQPEERETICPGATSGQ